MKFVIIKKSKFWLCVIAIICMSLLSIDYSGGVSASVYFGNAPRLVPIYSVETDELTGEQYIDYSFSTLTKSIKIKPSLNFNLTQDALNNVLDSNKRIYNNLRDSESTVSYDVAEPAFSKYVIIDPLNDLLPSGNKYSS